MGLVQRKVGEPLLGGDGASQLAFLRATRFVPKLPTGHGPRRHCDPGLDPGEAIQTHILRSTGLLRPAKLRSRPNARSLQ
jgi:hypothetical protein